METDRGSRIEDDHVTMVIINNPILCSDGSNRESRIEDGAVVAVEPIMRGDTLVNEIDVSNNVNSVGLSYKEMKKAGICKRVCCCVCEVPMNEKVTMLCCCYCIPLPFLSYLRTLLKFSPRYNDLKSKELLAYLKEIEIYNEGNIVNSCQALSDLLENILGIFFMSSSADNLNIFVTFLSIDLLKNQEFIIHTAATGNVYLEKAYEVFYVQVLYVIFIDFLQFIIYSNFSLWCTSGTLTFFAIFLFQVACTCYSKLYKKEEMENLKAEVEKSQKRAEKQGRPLKEVDKEIGGLEFCCFMFIMWFVSMTLCGPVLSTACIQGYLTVFPVIFPDLWFQILSTVIFWIVFSIFGPVAASLGEDSLIQGQKREEDGVTTDKDTYGAMTVSLVIRIVEKTEYKLLFVVLLSSYSFYSICCLAQGFYYYIFHLDTIEIATFHNIIATLNFYYLYSYLFYFFDCKCTILGYVGIIPVTGVIILGIFNIVNYYYPQIL